MSKLPKIYIVGGGFGGLAAAKALAKTEAEITLVDRRNHHLFQPLLYQVATASLSPADISSPIRSVFRDQNNIQVALVEVTAVDLKNKRLYSQRGYVHYDYLVLAAGATHAYFGHDEWATIAPGLKTLEDAVELRKRILLAFETAEYEGDDTARQAVLTFGIVGAGPTGVELAGAIKEIAGRTIPSDYKHIDTTTTRVILFQGEDRVLPGFPPELSERAKRDLERIGVEVRLNSFVTEVTEEGIYVGEEFIPVRNVFWAAGVEANSLGKTLGVPLDREGRVKVEADLSVPGHPEVFVIGDLANAFSADTKEQVPGVAQGAKQMGTFVGNTIARELAHPEKNTTRKAFIYNDKGTMAVIGKAKAVAVIGKLKLSGFIAWLVWGLVHIAFLIGFRNRLQVFSRWIWNWLINARDARLITGQARMYVNTPRGEEFILAELSGNDEGFIAVQHVDGKTVLEQERGEELSKH